MEQLDLKDRKILYELDLNSRQSYNKISKKVGLSKDSVIYRIENLRRQGIIKQFHTLVDSRKIGYTSFRLYLKLQNATPEKEVEIIEFLKSKKMVTWLVSIEGGFDIGMWILVKNVKEMNELWKELLQKYVNYISKRQLTIFTKVSYFTRAYLLGKKENEQEFVFISEPEKVELDETDLKILDVIAPDSRIPTLEIAKIAGITPKTAALRIRELEKKGVIVGYRAMFDPEKLGYDYFKVHFNLHNLTMEKEKLFRAYVRQHPNIIYDNEVLGGDDMEIDVQVRGLGELRALLDEIKKNFAPIIKEYKYFSFYREHKFVFLPA